MFDYSTQRQRRVGQFAEFLKPMHDRAHIEAQGSCFLILNERPGRSHDARWLSARRRFSLPVEARATCEALGGGTDVIVKAPPVAEPVEPWRDPGPSRFIQFCFRRRWFAMDLPRPTLFTAEAERLIRERDGFFREAERSDAGLSSIEQIMRFDPVFKKYVYGDEDTAAEDAAYIFFDLWRFPVDSRLYVTAAAFRGKKRWERNVPIE